jgi:hypothetical protein
MMFSNNRAGAKTMLNILLAMTFTVVGYWICCMTVVSSTDFSHYRDHPAFASNVTKEVRFHESLGRQLASSVVNDNIGSEIMKHLTIENDFLSTMRSCLGAFCFDDPVSSSNNVEHVRIGLLAPQLSAGPLFLKMLRKFNNKNKNVNIDILYDTHVPPYGYGKNHGWSRIIRIARRVIPHSFGILYNFNKMDEKGVVDVSLFEAQVPIY